MRRDLSAIMLLKLTATLLLFLMMAASATSQAGVKYCLCFHSVFVDACPCVQISHSDHDCEDQDEHCCSDCGNHQQETPTKTFQCLDCIVDLSIKIGDCTTPSIEDPSSKKSPSNSPISESPDPEGNQSSPVDNRAHEARGSPPPQLAVRPLPLFIRHSTFLV